MVERVEDREDFDAQLNTPLPNEIRQKKRAVTADEDTVQGWAGMIGSMPS